MADCQTNLYTIKFTDTDKTSILVSKGELVTDKADIAFVGKTKHDYGEIFNENVLHLLENFACPEDSGNPGNPDLASAFQGLLERPVEGQIWYNTTQLRPFRYNGTTWDGLGVGPDIAGNYGVIAHGEQLPQPICPITGYIFQYDECTWVVSPFNYPEEINFMQCYTDDQALVTMQYRPVGSSQLENGFVNYQIVGIRGNTNFGTIGPAPSAPANVTPTPTPASTVTPTNTITPTVTQGSTPTPTQTVTPTATEDTTPTVTPTVTPTTGATQTVTPTITPTMTQTPSNTPAPGSTITPTPTQTVTPTITPTQTVTPTRTPTQTPTRTPAPTQTKTPTPTPTRTPASSPNPTQTKTPTPTPTKTGTPTPTPTQTKTPTPTPSNTPSPSNDTTGDVISAVYSCHVNYTSNCFSLNYLGEVRNASCGINSDFIKNGFRPGEDGGDYSFTMVEDPGYPFVSGPSSGTFATTQSWCLAYPATEVEAHITIYINGPPGVEDGSIELNFYIHPPLA